jgi:hypothetical protein
MTLDDEGHPLHAHIRDRDQAQMADLRQFEQEDRERRWAEMAERDALESIEARETYWTGVRRQMPQHVKDTRYAGDAG